MTVNAVNQWPNLLNFWKTPSITSIHFGIYDAIHWCEQLFDLVAPVIMTEEKFEKIG